MHARALRTPGQTVKRLERLIAGYATMASTDIIKVAGKTYTVADYVAKLQGYLALFKAVPKAELELQLATKARNDAGVEIMDEISAAQASVKAEKGKRNPEVANWGIKPEKAPAPLPPKKRVVANEKTAATRAARHTMGPNQKEAITGETPPPPAPPPAPKP